MIAARFPCLALSGLFGGPQTPAGQDPDKARDRGLNEPERPPFVPGRHGPGRGISRPPGIWGLNPPGTFSRKTRALWGVAKW